MVGNGRVLFIIHDVYQDDNHFPSGVGYMGAILKEQGTDVKVYSQDVFHYTNEELAKYLQKEHFDLIGVGFMAARFTETVEPLCKVINKYKKDAWLVLGGQGPSPIPEYMLKTTDAHIVAIGEAEYIMVDLLKQKLESGDLSKVKGIAYRDGQEIYINERRKLVRDLDSLPFPDCSLFPMKEYTTCLKFDDMSDDDRVFSIITSRGCINRCNFCYRMEKGLRFRSIKNVIEEIITLKEKYGINYFVMNDELFIYPRKRIFEFHDELERNDLKIKYQCSGRVDIMDEEVAQALIESGCTLLIYGVESMDQDVLDLIDKHTTVEQNIQAAEVSMKTKLGIGINILWGNKGDTEESLKKNVQFLKKYNTYHQVRTIRPVTPYPGCPLYYEAINKGLLSGPEDFFAKFKNSDLLLVNFTNIPEKKFYKLLYESNKELILDHYSHTSKNMNEAKQLIQNFYDLYFQNNISFRGARRYEAPKDKI